MSSYIENESTAIFGRVTSDLSDLWTVDSGVPYTDESRWFNQGAPNLT